MTQAEYDVVAGELMELARTIEDSKRPGYTVGSEDVLANFKRVAERAGISVAQCWSVYFLKHIDAITSIMARPELPVSEEPIGRFADAVNYLRLGWALLKERTPTVPKSEPEYQIQCTNGLGETWTETIPPTVFSGQWKPIDPVDPIAHEHGFGYTRKQGCKMGGCKAASVITE